MATRIEASAGGVLGVPAGALPILSGQKGNFVKVWRDGAWRLYWGNSKLPNGARVLGVIERSPGEVGALIYTAAGQYCQGNAGILRSLPQRVAVRALLLAGPVECEAGRA
jgi:hypothetical protein